MVKCVQKGTHVVIQLSGLIPNGVYTIWVGVFQAPGLTPDYSNIIALGALGQPDGSQNAFVASAHGEAVISAFQPSGPLSAFDDRDSTGCLLDEFEVLFFVGLHLDGQTHGPTPAMNVSWLSRRVQFQAITQTALSERTPGACVRHAKPTNEINNGNMTSLLDAHQFLRHSHAEPVSIRGNL
jgi:hypothetical protein